MKESELREAINVVSSHRGATLEALIPALDGMPTFAQAKWVLWRSHQEHKASIPKLFADVLAQAAVLTDPVIGGEPQNRNWDPATARWR